MWNRPVLLLALFVPMVSLTMSAAEEPKSAAPSSSSSRSDGRSKLPGLDANKLSDPKQMAQAALILEGAYAGARQPEAVRMLISILKGSQMGPQDGWFGPAETRYTWKWLVQQQNLDAADSALARNKFSGPEALFKRLDRDGDGKITPGDLDWSDRNPYVQQSYMVNRLFRRINTRGDGKLTREDLDEFFKKASQGKDHIDADDLRTVLLSGGSGGFQPGDAPTPAVLLRGLFAGEIGSMNEGPHVDETAPDFTLKSTDGKKTVQLSKLLGAKPVVLVFGNFTCGPFRSLYPDVDAVYQRYKDKATFVMVYVREAHPTDGWHMKSNVSLGVSVKQPTIYGERVKVCDEFCEKLKPSMPVVVDEMNDPVGHAYSGMPARLYVIDAKGKVAYKSGRGPFGFRVGEMEQALVMCLLEAAGNSKEPQKSKSKPLESRPPDSKAVEPKTLSQVPVLDDDQAWKLLPRVEPRLPVWARILIEPLPKTTALMLKLDHLHRTSNPLGPLLYGKLRWVAADATGCIYIKHYAEADLQRAGASPADLKSLAGDWKSLPPSERAALEFARKLSKAASTVTDEEVAALTKYYGPEKVVAIVHTLAHANFQDRIFLALRIEVEKNGPYPPLDLTFDKDRQAKLSVPVRPDWKDVGAVNSVDRTKGPEWLGQGFDRVQKALLQQKARTARIPLPPLESLDKLPAEARQRTSRIAWSRVSMGYQPGLTQAWFECMNMFTQESKLDRVFANTLFWVITRSNECFY